MLRFYIGKIHGKFSTQIMKSLNLKSIGLNILNKFQVCATILIIMIKVKMKRLLKS